MLKDGELCVCEILPKIDLEQSNTSQHLTLMKNQGIFESRKDGSKVIYCIKNKEVYEMIKLSDFFLAVTGGTVISKVEDMQKIAGSYKIGEKSLEIASLNFIFTERFLYFSKVISFEFLRSASQISTNRQQDSLP